MIAEKSTTKVRENLGGDKIKMGFDEESIIHLMGVMTDLYSDAELAVIREYSTNAWDSHREAGNKAPIEVTTPSSLSPVFKVRDYGVGLSVNDIQEIYSKYGASTKRDSNDQVGMLGLGCKSALAYTPQFTLVGIKDGVRCQVSVSRDERGAGTMTVVDTSSTDEPNGVEISVTAKRHNEFDKKARNFFKFWPEGTVRINGTVPKRFEGKKLNDNLYLVKNDDSYSYSYTRGTNHVVMGGVAYPVNDEEGDFNTELGYGNSLVAFVGIGDVTFTPSREALQYTPNTMATLKRILADFEQDAKTATQKDIAAAKTPKDAIKTMTEWHEILPSRFYTGATYTYKGKKLPSVFKRYKGDKRDYDKQIMVTAKDSYVYSAVSNYWEIPARSWASTVWVENYTPAKLSAAQKKKMQQWSDENLDFEPGQYVLMDGYSIDSIKDWIDSKTIVDYEATIKPIKLPKQQTTKFGRKAGAYRGYENGSYRSEIVADEIDTSKPLYYVMGDYYSASGYFELLNNEVGDYTLITLPSNRVTKFERDFPCAIKCEDAAKALFEKWEKGISADDLAALHMHWKGLSSNYTNIDPAKVKDPELKKAAKVAQRDVENLLDSYNNFAAAGLRPTEAKALANPLRKYPLFDSYQMRTANLKDHMYLYLNAVYAARKKGDL